MHISLVLSGLFDFSMFQVIVECVLCLLAGTYSNPSAGLSTLNIFS